VTRARTAVDGAAPSADAGQFSLADPRGLDEADVAMSPVLAIPATREFIALNASPWIVVLAAVGAAAQHIGSRWLGKTTGPILEALVGRRR
jgi:hypothetical protein